MKEISLTNNHDDDTNQDRLPSTKFFSDETGSDSSEESTDFVNGNNQCNRVGSTVCVFVDSECASKGRTVNEAAHQTIVEADEKESETGQCGDGVEKGIALELNCHVEELLSCRSGA
jgi:hypothetical protein